MHRQSAATEVLTQAIVRYAVDRVRLNPPPLDQTRSVEELRAMAGVTISARGIGGLEALRIFGDVLAPACISVDHPRFLSFIPAAPTEAAVLFDLIVGASSIYAGSWMEGGGAVFAENEALAWIASLVGFPSTAGGVFVSGGTAGNLSALIAARATWRRRAGGAMDRVRALIVSSSGAHSSVAQAARVLDADVTIVDADESGKMRGDAVAAAVDALSDDDRGRVAAVVATAGTTNAGIVDDLAGAADAARRLGTWLHVDGAYGGAALCAPSVRHLFAGIERADSFILDPHKWLFAPFDSCALVYRDPELARQAHTQYAGYLDVLHDGDDEPWNPSDYAHHLSRRARGLPLWFSLATHGTDAYRDAVEATLSVTRAATEMVRNASHLELVLEPELSVIVFRRLGWGPADYDAWSQELLEEQIAFVVPTKWRGETVLRFCIVNPETSEEDLQLLVDSLAVARDKPWPAPAMPPVRGT